MAMTQNAGGVIMRIVTPPVRPVSAVTETGA